MELAHCSCVANLVDSVGEQRHTERPEVVETPIEMPLRE